MDTKKKLNPQYRSDIEQIKLDGEDYTDEEMKPVYKEQKQSLDTLHVMLGSLFIKYAIDGLLDVNTSQKSSITSQFDTKFKSIGKDLGTSEVAKVTDILSKSYTDSYYKNLYTMDSGLKVDLKFNILKQEYIDAVVNTKMSGEMYDSRIWKNKADLIDKLKSSLIDVMRGDTHLDKVAKEFQNTFNTTASQSQRLLRTENARVQSQASIDIAINTGVKQHMWSATLDNKTEPEDAENDGKVFDIDDDSAPEIPLHPNCRCCWVNMIDGWTPSVRKDNITKEIIPYQTYNDWKKDKGID